MKIVITGAGGYIGTIVSDRLSKYNPFLVDFRDGFITIADKQANMDFYDLGELKADVLIHLAAHISVPLSFSNSNSYYDNNCAKFHNFLNNNNNSFGHVIFASSFSVYDHHMNVNPESVYASTKLEGEWIVKRSGIPYSIFRFANPVGVVSKFHKAIVPSIMHGYPNVMWKMALRKKDENVFCIHNLPEMKRDFYPVDWIARAIEYVVANGPTNEILNLGSGKVENVVPLLSELCRLHNIPCKLTDAPPGTSLGIQKKYDVFSDYLQDGEIELYNPSVYCNEQLHNYYDLVS